MGNPQVEPKESDPPPSYPTELSYPSAPIAGQFDGANPNFNPSAPVHAAPGVITAQPLVQSPPGYAWPVIHNNQPKDWKYNCGEALCSGSECCIAWCFPCMSIAKTAEMLGLDGNRAFCFTFWGCAFALAFQQRELIRLKYNINAVPHTGCADFCCLLCCFSCTIAQSSLQLKYELLQNRQ